MLKTHMDLDLMRSLLAVAQHGAITDAAKAMGLSQPALSRRIQQLEELLGAELLQRSARGVVLTDMGRLAQREAAAMVERFSRLQQSVRDHMQLDTGRVRVGGGATAVSFLLPRAIAAFQRQHREIVFQLREAGSREIEQDVVDERLDLGIVTLPTRSPELIAEPLTDDRIVLVGARGHDLTGKRNIGIEALRGQGLVGFEGGSAIRQLIDAALRNAGVEMNVVMELRSIAAILQMVATTRSLAFISELGVPARDRRIVPIAVRGLRIVRSLAIIRKRDRPLPPAATAFAQTLAAVGRG